MWVNAPSSAALASSRETGYTFAEIDRVMMALGFTRSPKARPALVEKLKLLDARSSVSHIKAICVALRMNRDLSLAGPLAELLDKPGMTGHATPAEYYQPPKPGALMHITFHVQMLIPGPLPARLAGAKSLSANAQPTYPAQRLAKREKKLVTKARADQPRFFVEPLFGC